MTDFLIFFGTSSTFDCTTTMLFDYMRLVAYVKHDHSMLLIPFEIIENALVARLRALYVQILVLATSTSFSFSTLLEFF